MNTIFIAIAAYRDPEYVGYHKKLFGTSSFSRTAAFLASCGNMPQRTPGTP